MKKIIALLIACFSYTYAYELSVDQEYNSLLGKVNAHNRLVELKDLLHISEGEALENLAEEAKIYEQNVKSFLQRAAEKDPKTYDKAKLSELQKKLTVKF